MLTADKVISPFLRAKLPDSMKTCGYVKVKKDDIVTITRIVYDVYHVKDKDGKPMFTQGENPQPVINTTAYVGFDDNTITSFSGKTAIAQLVSETGEYPNEIGTYPVELAEPVKVKMIEVSEKRGSKEYLYLAFEPIE